MEDRGDTKEGWRRDVKALADSDVDWLLNGGMYYPAEYRTISELSDLETPSDLKKDSDRRHLKEEKLIVVGGELIEVKRESDSDIHLVIKEEHGRKSIIAEVPNPDVGEGRKSRFRENFRAVRNWLGTLSPRPSKSNHYPVMVTGVIFFDKYHNQTGASKNEVEIHPVLGIRIKE